MANYFIKEIDNKRIWHSLIKEFDDANIYQLWNFAKVVHKEKKVQHVGIFENNEVVALAQVRLKTIPLLNRGVAYIFDGPVWKKNNCEHNEEALYNIFDSLRLEYTEKKHLMLRINPNIFSDDPVYSNFTPLHFKCTRIFRYHNTLFFDLKDELEVLRGRLKHRWRKSLNRAERNGIDVISGTDKKLFSMFLTLYDQMIKRKKFSEYVNPYSFGKFNEELEEDFKLRVFIALKDNKPVSALIGSAVGSTGIALFSATSEEGLKCNASYLLHWERIKWFKQVGCKRYDLGGVDPIHNPSVYEFKSGISQNEFSHIGIFETFGNLFSTLVSHLGEDLRNLVKHK